MACRTIAVRRLLPRPAGAIVYELTAYGRSLDDLVLRLGRWGAQSLGAPRPGEVVTAAALVMALRATFRPDAARGLRASYEIRSGALVIHARIADGRLEAREGPLPDADLVIETGPALKALLAGEVGPAEAVESGSVRLAGDPDLLTRFTAVFQIPPRPPAQPA